MEQLLASIESQWPLLIEYKYLLIFLGATLESLNSLVLAGFLASIGAVKLWPAILICLAGEFLNGWLWYAVGYFGGAKPIDKWGRKDARSRKIIETVENYFHRYSGRAIILTKLTWSLTIATMIMAGSFKYDKAKFSWYNLIGSIGWTAIVFTIGYVFGRSYKAIFIVNNIMYVVLFLILAMVLIYVIKLIFRSAFVKSLLASERFREIGERMRKNLDKFLQG